VKNDLQGNDKLKERYCGCPTDSIYWGKDQKCRLLEQDTYWPYYSIVEHGDTSITPWIDGPSEDTDYVVNTSTNFFEPNGFSQLGIFFRNMGEDFTNATEVSLMTRENGTYLTKPTYALLQKYNISELYFTGYSDTEIMHSIEEAKILKYQNITLIEDAFDGAYYECHGSTRLTLRRNCLKKIKSMGVQMTQTQNLIKKNYKKK
jgi:hypothetical protein